MQYNNNDMPVLLGIFRRCVVGLFEMLGFRIYPQSKESPYEESIRGPVLWRHYS